MNTTPAHHSRVNHLARRLGSVVLALGPVAVIVVEVAGKFIP